MREPHRHALLAGVIVLIGALIARLGLGDVAVFGIDDANITHTYARNIAAGYGPVFYPGGERVEGSTSTLWTLITAAIWAVAGQAPLAFLALSAVVTWLSAYLTFRLWALVRDTLKLNAALGEGVVCAVLLCAPSWFVWNVWSLMDVTLWTMLLTLAVLVTARRLTSDGQKLWQLIAVHVLLAACRPEGIAMSIGLLGVAGGITLLSADDVQRKQRLPILWAALASIAAFGALSAIRVALFGYPMPNTYYAKVLPDMAQRLATGAIYTWNSILGWPVLRIGAICAIALPALRIWKRHADMRGLLREEGPLLLAPATIFGLMLATTISGGDHFALQRFFQPAAPMLAVCIAGAAGLLAPLALQRSRKALAGAAAAAGALVWLSASAFAAQAEAIGYEFELANDGRSAGLELDQVAKAAGQPVSIGVIAAGGIALTYDGGPVLDLLGLNWTAMAHHDGPRTGMANHTAFNADVFWGTPPDIVVSSGIEGAEGRLRIGWFEALAFKGLLKDAKFRERYQPFVIMAGRPRILFVAHDWSASHSAALSKLQPRAWSDIDIGDPGPEFAVTQPAQASR